MIQFRMPNGDIVPVPQDIHAAGNEAVQGFYDGQAERVAGELGISVSDLHSDKFAEDPKSFVAAKQVQGQPRAASAAADASSGVN